MKADGSGQRIFGLFDHYFQIIQKAPTHSQSARMNGAPGTRLDFCSSPVIQVYGVWRFRAACCGMFSFLAEQKRLAK
jgi:hypothetical protein